VADAKPFDLSRLSQFNRFLPPEFVTDSAHVTETSPESIESVGNLLTFSGPAAVDPPLCRSILKPVGGQANAPSIGMRGDGPDNQAIALSADDPVVVASEFPVTGCERMTFEVDNHTVPTRGVIERIEAPVIDGCSVIGLKVAYQETRTVDYAYAAIVDGHAFVLVQGRVNPDYPAQQVLSDLLEKAVATLRGQTHPQPPPAAPGPGELDIARLAAISSDFPRDFPVNGKLVPSKVEGRFAYQVGASVGSGKPVSVDPVQCRALFSPITVKGGADRMGVGAEGPAEQILNISAYTPVSVPSALPTKGCEQMSYRVDDDAVRIEGTADRMPAPSIDGAFTTAMRVNVDSWEFVEYHYVAILDNQVFVEVVARVHPEFLAEPILSDLLVKGVAAIRAK
jgi:hypothetical protein